MVGLVGCGKTVLSCGLYARDHNRLEMRENKEIIDRGVLQIKAWCLTFRLNLFNVLSEQAVARSSQVHFENLL